MLNIKEIPSYMSNIHNLINYFKYNMQPDMSCILPNNIKIYIPEIIDNICIFYLHTCYILWKKYKIVLGDQHSENIFIHWINSKSICGKTDLSKLKYINYSIGNSSFIKIKTYGMIYKIGDVGYSIMNSQDNVMVVANLNDMNDVNIDLLLKYKTKCYSFWDFILNIIGDMPIHFLNETIIYKIILKHNISQKHLNVYGTNNQYYNNMLSEINILNDDLYNVYKINSSDLSNSSEHFTNNIL
jgi:hypothetical protein